LQKELQKAIEALGCPFATTLMEKCVIDESHPQFAGMYAGAASDPKTQQLVEGADLVLDLGGVNLNDITTAAYSAKLDLSRFITVGLNDVRIGDDVIAGVRLADVLAELTKLKPPSARYRGTPQGLAPVNGKPSDRITMDALYPRYAAFLRAGDTVVLETASRKRAIISPSSIFSLRSVDPHGLSAGKLDPIDASRASKPRDVLGECPPLYILPKVFSNPIGHGFERQLTAFVLAIQPNDVEAIPSRDRLRAD
jgi:hypothetical protein